MDSPQRAEDAENAQMRAFSASSAPPRRTSALNQRNILTTAVLTGRSACDITTTRLKQPEILEGDRMKTFHRMIATMVVEAFIVSAPGSRAQVLSQVPDQTLVVIKVTNLQGFSTKFGKVATDLELAAQVPELADPLK